MKYNINLIQFKLCVFPPWKGFQVQETKANIVFMVFPCLYKSGKSNWSPKYTTGMTLVMSMIVLHPGVPGFLQWNQLKQLNN